jgi:predicted phosphodiesterase
MIFVGFYITSGKYSRLMKTFKMSGKMKVQVVSDLHLEFRDNLNKFRITAPILFMCGDICASGSDSDFAYFVRFLKYIAPKYDLIFHVPGNHEFYSTTSKSKPMNTIINSFKILSKKIPNYIFLCNNIAKIHSNGKYCYIIGATLWTHIDKEYYDLVLSGMNDYKCINTGQSKLTPQYVNKMNMASVKYIKKWIDKACKEKVKCIVMTHHKPYKTADFHPAYENDLLKIIKKCVIAWFYGHTHKADFKKINGTLFVSNPCGYPHERDVGYNPNMSFEITI